MVSASSPLPAKPMTTTLSEPPSATSHGASSQAKTSLTFASRSSVRRGVVRLHAPSWPFRLPGCACRPGRTSGRPGVSPGSDSTAFHHAFSLDRLLGTRQISAGRIVRGSSVDHRETRRFCKADRCLSAHPFLELPGGESPDHARSVRTLRIAVGMAGCPAAPGVPQAIDLA